MSLFISNVVTSYDYDAWGNPVGSLPAIMNPFTYTGREYDKETGLYYYRARYYSPQIGRFTSKDPLQIGFNYYLYTHNDPVNSIDPLGLIDCKVISDWRVLPSFRSSDRKPAYSFRKGEKWNSVGISRVGVGGMVGGKPRFGTFACFCISKCVGDIWIDVYRYTETIERIIECTETDECGKSKTYTKVETQELPVRREVERIEPVLSGRTRTEIGVPTSDGRCSCESLR